MARARNPNRDLAYKIWVDSGCEKKLTDIAEEIGVTSSTIRKWKSQDKWEKDTKRSAPNNKGSTPFDSTTKKVSAATIDLVNNDSLRDRQKQFCVYYLQRFNATWAYMQAYDVDYKTANVNGPRLLGNASVREQIDKLRNEIANDLFVTADEIAKQYAKQAFANIGDYVNFGAWPETLKEKKTDTEKVKDKNGKERTVKVTKFVDVTDDNGKPVVYNHSYTYFTDKANVDTSLIKSVKMGKDGAVVELYDKQKAMDALLAYLDKNRSNQNVETKLDGYLETLKDAVKGETNDGD